MHFLSPEDAAFAREVRDLIFEYSLKSSRAKTWDDLMAALRWVYAREHSFTFYINGDKQGQKFTSLSDWEKAASPEMKANYQQGRYVMANIWPFRQESKVEYIAHQIRDGLIASQDKVIAQLVREDGRLKYKHVDIYYEFI